MDRYSLKFTTENKDFKGLVKDIRSELENSGFKYSFIRRETSSERAKIPRLELYDIVKKRDRKYYKIMEIWRTVYKDNSRIVIFCHDSQLMPKNKLEEIAGMQATSN